MSPAASQSNSCVTMSNISLMNKPTPNRARNLIYPVGNASGNVVVVYALALINNHVFPYTFPDYAYRTYPEDSTGYHVHFGQTRPKRTKFLLFDLFPSWKLGLLPNLDTKTRHYTGKSY